MEERKPREFGPDVVRIGAFCLLLWLHYLGIAGMYSDPVTNLSGWLACAAREIALCCVPLFIMLTGYLKCGKELKKGYYRPLGQILCSWVLLSLVFLVYKIFALGRQESVGYWICNFFDFKLVDYSWYIEMYIGLFLLSPFLNAMWNQTARMRNHLILLATLIFLTFLPSTFNGVVKVDGNAFGIFPAYFTEFYFVTYYMLGCFLRTYPYKGKAWLPLIPLFLTAAGAATGNVLTRTNASDFLTGFHCSYNNLFIGIMSTSLFLIFVSCRTENSYLKKIAAWISSAILEAYLLSWIFDRGFFSWGSGTYGTGRYWLLGLLCTLMVFLFSTVTGKGVHLISAGICCGIRKLFSRGQCSDQGEGKILHKGIM